LRAREFLLGLSSAYGPRAIKGLRREVRQQARDILRHYPMWFDLGRADGFDQKAALEWANEDEAPHG
jgi:hypothetical protein